MPSVERNHSPIEKGFGRAMIQLLLDFARDNDCYKVMLLSAANRTALTNSIKPWVSTETLRVYILPGMIKL